MPLSTTLITLSPQVLLLSNGSSTGNPLYWQGGCGAFTCVGTFGGCTVTLQYLGPDQLTYVACGTNTTLTAPGNGLFYLPECYIQAAVSGGSPSGLYASAGIVAGT